MFNSIITTTSTSITLTEILICFLTSIACGWIISFLYRLSSRTSRSFATTLVILPSVVMAVILLVNGNLGIGVAVAGSFSLVRFRSMPGKADDIATVFLAMACGLATGCGYCVFAIALAVSISIIHVCITKIPTFEPNRNIRTVKITIPEDLDYADTFDDILQKYAKSYRLNGVRTVNLGTMYQLNYEIELKNIKKEKEMIDEMRCRNGNLTISSFLKAEEMTDL